MEQLSLNYAQISAALIAQTKPVRRSNFNNRSTQYNTQHNSQSNNQYDNRKPLQCYGCGQLGHIKRNCPKTRSNNTVRFNNRQINFCDTDYEYESAEEDEEDIEEFDEFETYLTT